MLKPLLAIAALLAVAAAAWLFLSGEGDVAPESPGVPRSAPSADGAPAAAAGDPAQPESLQELELPEPAPDREPAFEPETGPAGTVLEGAVLTPAGSPLRDAVVTLYRTKARGPLGGGSAKRVAPPAATDARGRFSFQGLAGGSDYAIVVEHGAYATAEVLGIELAAGERTEIADVLLASGARIHGTVTRPDGRPLAGAKVAVFELGRDDALRAGSARPVRQALSDDDGVYSFENLRPGLYELRAAAKTFESALRPGIDLLSGAGELRVDFALREGHFVSGAVRNTAGEPVAGASVEARPMAGGGAAGEPVATRSDGTFRIEGLPAVQFRLVARAAGHSPAQKTLVDPDSEDVQLRLSPNSSITGTVRTADGKPVKSFGILVWNLGRNGYVNDPLRDLQRFDSADGSYTVEDVPPGKYKVQAFANDWAPTWTKGFAVGRVHVHGVDVEMQLGAALHGTVVDLDGKPVAGASVRLIDNAYLPTPLAGLLFGKYSVFGTTSTDAEGAFRFERLDAGTFQVEVTARGYPALYRKDLATVLGEDKDAGAVTLLPGGRIEGTVLDDQNLPERGATVTILAEDGSTFETRADQKGEFEFAAVPPRSYQIVARAGPSSKVENPIAFVTKVATAAQRISVDAGVTTTVVLYVAK